MFKFQCFQRTFRTKYQHFESICHPNKTNHLLTDLLIILKNNFLHAEKADIYMEEQLLLEFLVMQTFIPLEGVDSQ